MVEMLGDEFAMIDIALVNAPGVSTKGVHAEEHSDEASQGKHKTEILRSACGSAQDDIKGNTV